MKRTKTEFDKSRIPNIFHSLCGGATLYDSSCSPEARVIYIERDGGYYLKSAEKGTLRKEAELTRYFHGKGLAAEVLEYFSDEQDWLLTERVKGEDCTHSEYLANPERLCDVLAERLRALHELDAGDCPFDRTADYIATAENNYHNKLYDTSLFPDNWGYASADEAFRVVEENKHRLKRDVIIHGDYCLPNIMLDDWKFSGFIDLGNGGRGDRHIDLFWGAWTLWFNLKTDKYRERFFDAYGREFVDREMLDVIAAFEVFG